MIRRLLSSCAFIERIPGMKKIFFISLVMLIMGNLVVGCSKKDESAETPAGKQIDKTISLNAADPGVTVATINGRAITDGEIDREMKMIKQQMASRVSPQQMQAMQPGLKRGAMDNIINRVLLRQAADRDGIEVSKEEKDAKIEEIKKNFPSEEAFNAQIKVSGLSEEEFDSEIEYTIKIEALIDKVTKFLEETTDKEAREFYDSNMDQFVSPAKIRASHVLLKIGPEDTDEVKAEKKAKIEKLLPRLQAGEDIAEIASEYSDCPSSSNGGDLGLFGKGQMVKSFEDAAFALEVNELSGIVETRFGYHIIKVTEKEKASTTPFADVREDVKKYLDEMKKQREVEEYVQALKGLAEIEYMDSTLAMP